MQRLFCAIIEQTAPLKFASDQSKYRMFLLFAKLGPHPDLSSEPPTQTIYFFGHLIAPGETWLERLFTTMGWWRRNYRRYALTRPARYLLTPGLLLQPWRLRRDWRYIFARHDDAWYLDAFDVPARYSVTGEISPPYFFLPEAGVAHVRRLCPHARIIIFVRNPMDWCWSFAKMVMLQKSNRRAGTVSEREVLHFIEQKTTENRFSTSLDIWRRHFPEEQLKVIFFDSLRESPAAVFDEIAAFIGLDTARMPAESAGSVGKTVNPGIEVALSPTLAREIARLCRDDVEALCAMFDGYPQRWRDQLARRLATE